MNTLSSISLLLILLIAATWSIGFGILEPPIAYPTGYLENLTTQFNGFQAYLDNDISFKWVQGTSMGPAFETGDLLLWVNYPMENIRIGDIILWEPMYTWPRDNIAHRVVERIDAQTVVTKGDNMSSPDSPTVKKEYLHGLIIGVIFTSSEGWHA